MNIVQEVSGQGGRIIRPGNRRENRVSTIKISLVIKPNMTRRSRRLRFRTEQRNRK